MTDMNEIAARKKPIFYWISLVSALISLISPFVSGVIYWLLTLDTRDDGWIAAFVFGTTAILWLVLALLSIGAVIIAFLRKESGLIKVFACIAAGISTLLIVGIILFVLIGSSLDKY